MGRRTDSKNEPVRLGGDHSFFSLGGEELPPLGEFIILWQSSIMRCMSPDIIMPPDIMPPDEPEDGALLDEPWGGLQCTRAPRMPGSPRLCHSQHANDRATSD